MTDTEKIINAFIAEAMKQAKPEAPKPATKPTPKETATRAAKASKELYDAYIAEGFSEVQAFELVKTTLLLGKK